MGAAEEPPRLIAPSLNGLLLPIEPILSDRWNFILPTLQGMQTPKRALLAGAPTVVVEDAVRWCREHHADVWATDMVPTEVASFPPGLAVWGPLEARAVWARNAVPFVAMPANAVVGPGGVPREADAFFKALGHACDNAGARTVRVFGPQGWRLAANRWKRWALANAVRELGRRGIDVQLAVRLA